MQCPVSYFSLDEFICKFANLCKWSLTCNCPECISQCLFSVQNTVPTIYAIITLCHSSKAQTFNTSGCVFCWFCLFGYLGVFSFELFFFFSPQEVIVTYNGSSHSSQDLIIPKIIIFLQLRWSPTFQKLRQVVSGPAATHSSPYSTCMDAILDLPLSFWFCHEHNYCAPINICFTLQMTSGSSNSSSLLVVLMNEAIFSWRS